MANDFKSFAASGGANVSTQVEYEADTATLTNGFTTGIADSKKLNKVWRQSSIVSKVITDFINTTSGADCIDDGTTSTILKDYNQSVLTAGYLTAAGATTAYTATSTLTYTTIPNGFNVKLDISAVGSNSNTAPTLSIDGLTARVIKNQNGVALEIGDIPTVAYLVYDLTNLAWVLINPLLSNSYATKVQVDTSIANHVALADPHTQYTTQAEVDTSINNSVAPTVSQAEAEAGVATTVRSWTAERVRQAIVAYVTGGYAISLTTDGYIKLPSFLGGLIMQWGTVTRTGINTIVIFSLPFPTACLNAIVCNDSVPNGEGEVGVGPLSATQMTLIFDGNSTVIGGRYFAVGY